MDNTFDMPNMKTKPFSLGGVKDEDLLEELSYRLSVGYNIPGSIILPETNALGKRKAEITLWV